MISLSGCTNILALTPPTVAITKKKVKQDIASTYPAHFRHTSKPTKHPCSTIFWAKRQLQMIYRPRLTQISTTEALYLHSAVAL